MAKTTRAKRRTAPVKRTYDALPDSVDFRDAMYIPSLVSVKAISDIDGYRKHVVPVLDQGTEGACTGYALATVANYLMRARGEPPKADEASAWMFYTMAKRYDEWPGEDYEGSSARGAMKGWHKHGCCQDGFWRSSDKDQTFNLRRSSDAIERPLGAYFRVNHKDLVAMHAAISEVGVLYATSQVHDGWQDVQAGDKAIAYRPGMIGGHAFAIVGYDRDGFWIQNSWGTNWGDGGIALLSYADWLSNGTDVWVAALGAPIQLGETMSLANMRSGAPRSYEARVVADLRPYIITAKNDGVLDDKGVYGLNKESLGHLMQDQLVDQVKAWKTKRVLLYAHGGLVSQDSAVQTVSNNRGALIANEVYPLSFIWRSDAWSTITDILGDAMKERRDEGVFDQAKDFVFDRIDDTLEVVARQFGGKALWDEMKENAIGATEQALGAARQVADHLVSLVQANKIDEIHLVGHSAGSIFHARLAKYLADAGVTIASLSLWAPACTIDDYNTFYAPLIAAGTIKAFDLYVLDDATEQSDDCGNIYHKSLLYLVSAAFEAVPRIPWNKDKQGTPLLGLLKDVRAKLGGFEQTANCKLYIAPGADSRACHHGDFDDDLQTRISTLERIIPGYKPPADALKVNVPQSRTKTLKLYNRVSLAVQHS